jgi:hypothetical protein
MERTGEIRFAAPKETEVMHKHEKSVRRVGVEEPWIMGFLGVAWRACRRSIRVGVSHPA